ncbi:MAG TPA: hypothetical protein VFV34_22630 [Blastocatellia bacterium]|nr:hypothetical protein [Blastocatellia bacterium]
MAIVGIVGMIVMVVGGIWILVLAFQESLLWGICCLIIPLVSLYFAITRWSKTKVPFLIYLGGAALLIVGGMMQSGE